MLGNARPFTGYIEVHHLFCSKWLSVTFGAMRQTEAIGDVRTAQMDCVRFAAAVQIADDLVLRFFQSVQELLIVADEDFHIAASRTRFPCTKRRF